MQRKVKEFNDNKGVHSKEMSIPARLMDIGSEFGELQKEYLKCTKYGTKDFVVTPDFIMEYGDVLYSLLSLANELKIDANGALSLVLEKYQKRINEKGNMGSGN